MTIDFMYNLLNPVVREDNKPGVVTPNPNGGVDTSIFQSNTDLSSVLYNNSGITFEEEKEEEKNNNDKQLQVNINSTGSTTCTGNQNGAICQMNADGEIQNVTGTEELQEFTGFIQVDRKDDDNVFSQNVTSAYNRVDGETRSAFDAEMAEMATSLEGLTTDQIKDEFLAQLNDSEISMLNQCGGNFYVAEDGKMYRQPSESEYQAGQREWMEITDPVEQGLRLAAMEKMGYTLPTQQSDLPTEVATPKATPEATTEENPDVATLDLGDGTSVQYSQEALQNQMLSDGVTPLLDENKVQFPSGEQWDLQTYLQMNNLILPAQTEEADEAEPEATPEATPEADACPTPEAPEAPGTEEAEAEAEAEPEAEACTTPEAPDTEGAEAEPEAEAPTADETTSTQFSQEDLAALIQAGIKYNAENNTYTYDNGFPITFSDGFNPSVHSVQEIIDYIQGNK